MAHGYAKIEGKPMAMICHGTVGLQHATMAMYNAWCDRVPVYRAWAATSWRPTSACPGAEWVHSAIDIGALVRDFTKWDDQPASLQHFAESAVRAYKIAMTPPMGPVLLSLDAELQENPIPDAESLRIPKLARSCRRRAMPARIAEAAKMLVAAREPGDHLRSPGAHAGRHGAPRRAGRDAAMRRDRQCRAHELPVAPSAQSELPPRPVISQADVILAIEMNDLWGALNAFSDRIVRRVAPDHQEGRQDHHARRPRSLSESQLSGLRPLPGCRSRHRRRRRGVAAGADRGGEALDRRRPQGGLRSARQETRCAASRHGRAVPSRDATHRLGREPDHDRAHVRRGLCPDQGRGLVAGRHLHPH